MKKIFKLCCYLIVILIATPTVFGQEDTFIVNGKIKDSDTKEVLGFATIEVKTNKDSLCYSLISDSEGEFTFQLKSGTYNVKINYLGYNEFEISVIINDKDVFLGNLNLVMNSTDINEVTITASNHFQKIDREVHIVTKEMRAGTSTVKTLLNRVKGVSYDPIGNNIKVNNDSQVLLLVDGLEKDQEYIKNLNPDRVLRIEILKEPGGSYASEGYSSLINFILKKDFTGYDITIDNRAIFDLKSIDSKDALAINNLFSSFEYTVKKLNIYGAYSNDRSNINLIQHEDKSFNNFEIIKSPTIKNNPNIQVNNYSTRYTLGVDYHINTSNIVSIENSIMKDPHDKYMERFHISKTNEYQSDNYNSSLHELSNSNNLTSQLAYLFHNEKNDLKLNFGYNFYEYNLNNSYLLLDTLYFVQKNRILKDYAKLDLSFNRLLFENIQVEVGYGGTWQKTELSAIYNFESLGMSLQDYSRNLVYSYLIFNHNEYISSKIGLSSEYSKYSQTNTNYSFINFYPLLNIQYKPSNKTIFTLKYRSTGEYPKINQLNPYPTQNDAFTGEVGNPSLRSSNLHKVSVNIGLFDGVFDIEPYYSFSNNYIDRVGIVQDTIFLFTSENIDKYQKYGTNLTFEFNFLKNFYWNGATNIYWAQAKYGSYDKSLFDWSTNLSLLYYYPKFESIIAVLLKKENVKNISAFGYYTDNNDYLAIYFDQSFFKEFLNLSILYTLPVDLGLKYTIDEKFDHLQYKEYRRTDVSLVSNLLMINFTFRINNMRNDRSVKKKNLWEDESKKRGNLF